MAIHAAWVPKRDQYIPMDLSKTYATYRKRCRWSTIDEWTSPNPFLRLRLIAQPPTLYVHWCQVSADVLVSCYVNQYL